MTKVYLAVAVTAAAALIGGQTSANADPVAGCPLGGGWQLVSATVGPGATAVDAHGNNDGYACKTVFTNGAGSVVAQVIDNRVQAP
jgi:hypothetical protein